MVSRVSQVLVRLRGKKTYITVAAGLVYVAGCLLGIWDFDERVLAAFGLGGIAFLRKGAADASVSSAGGAAAPAGSAGSEGNSNS